MATIHTVQQGEHLSRIAEEHGFLDHRSLWDDPANASLKSLRQNPSVLFPGDQVHIPEKFLKSESVSTARTHTFSVKLEKLLLKVAMRDHEDSPIANTPLKIEVEGSIKTLTTDGTGQAERQILKKAVNGMVSILDFEIPLKIGHLDPVEEFSGQKARLSNVGYDAGESDSADDMQFRSAVEEFQCDKKLGITGICNAVTQAKLKEVHGS